MKWCIPREVERNENGVRWSCVVCGFTDTDTNGHFPDRIYRRCDVQALRLGDIVAWLLLQIGIRKRPDCRCGDRQEAMNRWGFRLAAKWQARWLWWRNALAAFFSR